MAERIKPFSDIADMETGEFTFNIGDKTARDFYYGILVDLMSDPMFTVKEEEGLSDAVPPEAEFTFYFDYADETVSCRCEIRYDDGSYIMSGAIQDEFDLGTIRDRDAELRAWDLLLRYFRSYDSESQAFYNVSDDDYIYDLLENGIDEFMRIGSVETTDAFSNLRIRRKFPVTIGVSVVNDLMKLNIKTDDMGHDELLAIFDSYTRKKRYHRLKSGEFVDLTDSTSVETLMDMLEPMGVSIKDFVKGKIEIPAYRALYLDKMLEEHEEVAATRDRKFRSLIKGFKTVSDSEYEVPETLEGTLRKYQDYGFRWMRTLELAGFGGILADDMGLGKTLEVLTLLLADKHDDGDLKALVVCPASVVYNWIEEIGRFAPELSSAAVVGTKAERRKILTGEEVDIYVTSYDLLKRDIDMYDDMSFTHQIADEAQFIKNAKSIGAKAMKLVHAEHKFALTGTPIENRLAELWSIFDYLMPGFLYGYESFRSNYETPIAKQKDEKKTEVLKNMVSPFILRRRKEDVLKDLPEKIEEVQYVHLESKQQKLYDGQVVRLKDAIEKGDEDVSRGKIKILAELTRIRQICCDPGLLFTDYDGESAKREACEELIASAADSGHKMLVFSQFTSMLALLEEDLENEGISYYKIEGATSKEERMRLVRAFNQDDTPVFLISLKSGGTGLNLTGADIVIHYDPWWNLAAQNQATDRAHRIGQTKNVTVYKLIVKDSIEENILKLQKSKKELADSILNGEAKSLGQMSKDELLALIGA